ncbi:casein kinase 2 regulatory subunit [Sorochytrium milnesiophthora]
MSSSSSSDSSDTAFSDLSSSEASSGDASNITWIEWFCSLPGHDFFCHVEDEFIEDDFNLTGLSNMVPYYREAMDLILDLESEDAETYPDANLVESSAELLYGLIHARFITSRQGLQTMLSKLEHRQFGICPRVYCYTFPLLPVGLFDSPGQGTVQLYCHNCKDIYTPHNSRYARVDGAFFGATFPHLLFQTYPDLYKTLLTAVCANALSPSSEVFSEEQPTTDSDREQQGDHNGGDGIADTIDDNNNSNAAGGSSSSSHRRQGESQSVLSRAQKVNEGRKLPQIYVSRIFGFRVNEASSVGPQCAWLRWQSGLNIRTGYFDDAQQLSAASNSRRADRKSLSPPRRDRQAMETNSVSLMNNGTFPGGFPHTVPLDNDGDAVMGK